MKKMFCLLLILIFTASSLIAVRPAHSSTTKPSVPEFTLKLVAYPYDVPTTYGIDPYTGKNVTIQEGFHVENKSIEVAIRNQPSTTHKLENDHYINLFYNISYKGHYEKDWSYYSYEYNSEWFLPSQSESEYTVISFKQIPSEGQMDFRVQALIGYFTHYYMPFKVYEFTGETSGWSETQTITIPASAISLTILLMALIGTAIAVVLVGVGLLVYFKKRKRNTYENSVKGNTL
jgi:hypothetical protein